MWSLCFILVHVVQFGSAAYCHLRMADKRPRRQRKVRSSTEFFGAGLLHKEEVELRKALNASLREVRNPYPKKQEKPSESLAITRSVCTDTNRSVDQKEGKPNEPVETTKTICTGTNTKFRIKSDRIKKSDNTNKGKGDSFEKKKAKGKGRKRDTFFQRKECKEITFGSLQKKKKKKEIEGRESETFQTSCKVSNNSLKRKCEEEATKDGKDGSKKSLKGGVGKSVAWKELKSPTKTNKVDKSSRGKNLKILAKGKAAIHKSLDNGKLKGTQKRKVVQSLTKKFSATVRVEKQSIECQNAVESCSDGIKKKKSALLKDNIEKSVTSLSEVTSNPEKNCELRQEVSNALQGKMPRRLKHMLKNRRLVSPLGEIYVPANVAKTEDFLTFLCLRGNSSLPKCFDVFKDPDPFFTQPAHQFRGDTALSCPALPMQSSVIYSPPSSCPPSESSAASPMSSIDSWMLNDD